MQIATWNVNSLKVRLPQVIDWLKTSNCDVLALQELKLDNMNFPIDEFKNLGYQCVYNGQRTYNGVAIISKLAIDNVVHDIPGYDDQQKRVISATINGIRIICVYVVNGESIVSEKYLYKQNWLKELHKYIDLELKQHPQLMVLGDFNIAPHDIDIYDPIALEGGILCSEIERKAFFDILELGLHDSFRIFNNEAKQYSWWDYRSMAFRRKMGIRIDHILISEALKYVAKNCTIDIEPRKNERPSDHAPVIIHL